MNSENPAIAALVDAQARVIGLPLDAAHQPGVVQNLERLAEMAQSVMDFPLPHEVESAAVFSHDKS